LDLKLGVRMLIKHPGLTVIATMAVAFAIAVGVRLEPGEPGGLRQRNARASRRRRRA
jgi:hypothetical protein